MKEIKRVPVFFETQCILKFHSTLFSCVIILNVIILKQTNKHRNNA